MGNNIFETIKNYIINNPENNRTYGDIIQNGNINNSVKQICSSDEYDEFIDLQKQTKKRFIKENYTEIPNNYLMGSDIKQGQQPILNVPGIGEVKQIC